jgi:hypothetical protein
MSAERLRQIAVELLQIADGMSAPPAPEPPPPAPEPPPPPPGSLSPMVVQAINRERLVCFSDWLRSGSYERFSRLVHWTGASATVGIARLNTTSSGDDFKPAMTYTLLIDGAPSGEFPMDEGQEFASVTVALDGMPEGWRQLDLGGLADGESCPTFFAYHGDAQADRGRVPVVGANFDLHEHKVHAYRWAPAWVMPTAEPLPPQEYPHFTDTRALKVDMLVPGDNSTPMFQNVSAAGVLSTACKHSYFWSDLIKPLPVVQLLDGPRGIGACSMVTHINIGKATETQDPASAPRLNIYACDPWRVMRISDDGAITTLAGYRNADVGGYWQDESQPTLELVGDWSAVFEDRRGFHELWGLAWDSDTLAVDPSQPPIDGRPPHVVGPACVVTDSQNGRLCRLTFSPIEHGPAKVTEWVTGLNDPWDIVEWRDEMIVSVRGSHEIIAFKKDLGTARTIVARDPSLPGDAKLSANHDMRIVGSLADAQAQPCLGPEGLAVLDDWLYYGSFCQRQVRRVHLVTGEVEVFAVPVLDGNSRFVKLALSDGTFGPRGTLFVQSWSLSYTANTKALLPDGSVWNYSQSVPFGPAGYGCSVAVGDGRMYCATSEYGIRRYSGGQPWDRALALKGKDEFHAMHGRHQWGPHGFYAEPQPLPWGKSEALDYYLKACGHA